MLQPHAISLYLYAWTIFTLLMFVASLQTSGAVALVFFLLTVTFLLLAIGNANLSAPGTNNTIKWGGYLGLATAAFRRGTQRSLRSSTRPSAAP